MRYATLCSGIEACSVAWEPLGFEPMFFSEIAQFPNAVLSHYYPSVPNLGDMENYKQWDDYAVELICAGTPCQAFSVAGLREGLADPRGNLTLTFLGVLAKYRPRWVVWENVSGVLSDPTNAFGNLLGGLGKLGYGFAYRVLDAQYFGIPQRRRRVFVVAHLGDWIPSASVLFDPYCLSGFSEQVSKERHINTLAHASGDAFLESQSHTQKEATISTNYKKAGDNIQRVTRSVSTRLVSDAVTSKWMKQSGGYSGFETGNMVLSFVDGEPEPRVRRLTPVECERLQGFPDGYTDIPWSRIGAPDYLRYEAIGNSMAVPVMRWIGERIKEIDNIIKK